MQRIQYAGICQYLSRKWDFGSVTQLRSIPPRYTANSSQEAWVTLIE